MTRSSLTGDSAPNFSTLYREELAYICNSLKRLGVQQSDLEDLAHEVFLKVFRSYASYDSSRPFHPWLFGIVFRTVSDFRRRAHHWREVRSPAVGLSVLRSEGEDRLKAEEDRQIVLKALGRLELKRRAVFIMREIDGCPVAEIAQTLDLPENTVYSRLRVAWREFERALKDLKESIE